MGSWVVRKCDLLIAVPQSGGVVYWDWAVSFAQVVKNAPPNTYLQYAPEPQIDTAREKLAQMGLNLNAQYIFWLDSDVIPPKDVIWRLIRTAKRTNASMVSGLYARRHHPNFNEMLLWGRSGNEEGYIPIGEGQYEKDALIPCDAVGFGCVLLKTDALRDVERPWFKWTEGSAMRGVSEDFYFCRKFKQAGHKIIVDTSVVCQHMGPVKVMPAFGAGLNVVFTPPNVVDLD